MIGGVGADFDREQADRRAVGREEIDGRGAEGLADDIDRLIGDRLRVGDRGIGRDDLADDVGDGDRHRLRHRQVDPHHRGGAEIVVDGLRQCRRRRPAAGPTSAEPQATSSTLHVPHFVPERAGHADRLVGGGVALGAAARSRSSERSTSDSLPSVAALMITSACVGSSSSVAMAGRRRPPARVVRVGRRAGRAGLAEPGVDGQHAHIVQDGLRTSWPLVGERGSARRRHDRWGR